MKWMVFYVKFSQVSNLLHWEILSLCSLVISRKLNLIKRDCDLLYLFSELRIEDIQKFVNIRNTRCTKTSISCFVSDFSWQLNSSSMIWYVCVQMYYTQCLINIVCVLHIQLMIYDCIMLELNTLSTLFLQKLNDWTWILNWFNVVVYGTFIFQPTVYKFDLIYIVAASRSQTIWYVLKFSFVRYILCNKHWKIIGLHLCYIRIENHSWPIV